MEGCVEVGAIIEEVVLTFEMQKKFLNIKLN